MARVRVAKTDDRGPGAGRVLCRLAAGLVAILLVAMAVVLVLSSTVDENYGYLALPIIVYGAPLLALAGLLALVGTLLRTAERRDADSATTPDE